MHRLYASKTGEVRELQPGENSHYGMARTILGPEFKGDAEDAYAAMWNNRWIRVVDYGNKVCAEMYWDGKPVKLAELSRQQRQLSLTTDQKTRSVEKPSVHFGVSMRFTK